MNHTAHAKRERTNEYRHLNKIGLNPSITNFNNNDLQLYTNQWFHIIIYKVRFKSNLNLRVTMRYQNNNCTHSLFS